MGVPFFPLGHTDTVWVGSVLHNPSGGAAWKLKHKMFLPYCQDRTYYDTSLSKIGMEPIRKFRTSSYKSQNFLVLKNETLVWRRLCQKPCLKSAAR